MFREVYAEKRAEKEAGLRGNRGLKRKLDLLDRMRDEGLLDDEEYQARKEDLLADS